MISFRSEYGAFWKCIQAGMVYMFTQLAKMLVLATFFPDSTFESGIDLIGVSWGTQHVQIIIYFSRNFSKQQ